MTFQEKYVNPFTDFGFKKLFGEEINKDLLIDFLNTLLPKKHQIKELSYKKTENLGNNELDRKAIFDLYCVSNSGDRFIVEMQKAKQNYFKDRSIFYATFPIQEQALKGDWDYKLAPVYNVGILDFVFEEDKNNKQVIYEVQLKDQDCKVFYEKLTFIYLSMPNFSKTEDELETLQDKWLYLLKYLPTFQDKPLKFQEKIFQKLFNIAELAKFSRDERSAYETSMKYYRDLKNVTDTAWDEGKMEGKIEIIIAAFKEGFTNEQLSRISELSISEIEEIIKNYHKNESKS